MEWSLLREAASWIAGARSLVAFTGAGISEESGIPTFRGEGGLWDRYPPERFAHIPGLMAEFLLRPERVAAFLREILQACLDAEPNPAHLALARWEAQGKLRAVITQNIDTLHERAGSRKVIKLHGSIDRLRCTDCGFRQDFDGSQLSRWRAALLPKRMGRRQLWQALKQILSSCPYCGGRRRPDVVLFGDLLPQDAWGEAQGEASLCDLLMVIGTSGLIYPAAEIPLLAKRSGATLIEINPQPTSLTPDANLFLAGKAGEVLKELLDRVPEIP
ncbi:MAG: NAD-dependent deacylase [candidate division NC10 bacterium]|nr:NAD-dependent deacylase [candidate division NC10 bacterium]